jgi:hypothetical protein
MNPLESLKERLKHKPEVQPNPGVKVILAPQIEEKIVIEEKNKPLITAEKDEGKRAKDILERIRQKKLSAVIKKLPEEIKEPIMSQAPPIQETKKKQPKKLSRELIILEEEKERPLEDLPEGGPRLEEEGVVEELVIGEDVILPTKPRKRTTKKVTRGIIPLGTELMMQIGDTPLAKRLPPLQVFDMKVSSYYMNNREIFVNFINGVFEPYKEDLLDETKGISCEDIGKDSGTVSLLTHQKIVRDYMNLYTPYRGLLLFHGLGSGKTCSSIAIAEGMKSARKVYIMTPASLRRNYIEEIKKCGDLIYRKNQFWEWISLESNPELLDPLAASLGLPLEYVRRHQGAWLVNITKQTNYNDLTTSDKKVLNDQLDEMIKNKYTFINYNGLRRDKFKSLTNNFENNIFDNSVVIIDEAHNLISRIVNKINKIAKFSEKKRGPGELLPESLSLLLYEFLLRAENCRVVLLTGTPIINYPNEIGILFNILRGYIKTWNFTLSTETTKKLSTETLQEIFSKEKVLDYIDFIPSSKTLTVTRNPYGFDNKITASSGYKGVNNEKKEKRNENGEIEREPNGTIIYEERGNISDAEFIKRIVKILKKNDINAVTNGTTFTVNTALPDTLDEFINTFIDKDSGRITNIDKFKRRIIGLTSYFRSAQEELLPSYDKNFDRHEVYIPMSDYQFKIYEDYRQSERKSEKPGKKSSGTVDKDGIFKEPSSTYRIFSRLACNFVMPEPPGRPNPDDYRYIMETKKDDKLLEWMKEKYFTGKREFDADIEQKYIAFKSKIPEENLTKYNSELQNIISLYLKEYFKKNYREPIEVFAEKNGAILVFEKAIENERLNELAVLQKADAKQVKTIAKDLAKAEAKEKKDKEKADKVDEKTRQKEAERIAKELAKAKEKEEAEALEKTAKEKARAAKQKEKEDAKLALEMIRAEKNIYKQKPVAAVKIAIIVPFRDQEDNKRTEQLNEFVTYMKIYLQGYDYKIFVIEQSNDERKFNRGELLNIGFKLADKEGYNNFVFHDVDLLPSNDLKPYYTSVPKINPIHIAAVWDRYGSNSKYFGGIVAFNKEMFEKINGYPNNFWGWGGEDDELYNRTKKYYTIFKPNQGSIKDLENLKLEEKLEYLKENDLKFMQKREALAQHEATWRTNGLSSMNYTLENESSCGENCEKITVELVSETLVSDVKQQTLMSFEEAYTVAKKYIKNIPAKIPAPEPVIPNNYNYPPEANDPIWDMSDEALKNTLNYILEYLSHSCYMLCVEKSKGIIYKLERRQTAEVYKPIIAKAIRDVTNNDKITEKQKRFIINRLNTDGELRFMQCVVKEFNPKKESYSSEYPEFIKGLKLPDGVYILNLTDAVILRKDGKHPFPMVTGNLLDIGKYKTKKFIPIFSISGQKGYYDIPIPNYDDVMYVLGKSNIDASTFVTNWADKKTQAVFRGGPTGCGYTTETNQRLKLKTINSNMLDIEISGTGATIDTNSIRFDPKYGIGMLNTGIKPSSCFLTMKTQSEYKYIIHVDGNVNAYRLLTTMLTGSLILRVESEYTSWLDSVLQPNVHYIPIKPDLSDLLERIEECERDNERSKEIARTAMELARNILQYRTLRGIFQFILQNVSCVSDKIEINSSLHNDDIIPVKSIKSGNEQDNCDIVDVELKAKEEEEEDFKGGAKTKGQIIEEPPKENPAENFVDNHEEDEEIILEDYKDEDANLREIDELEGDELLERMGSDDYKNAIKAALRYLKFHSQEFLTPEGLKTYSPKFLAMLENIEDPEHQGLHLIYSQFRSMEGIGIFCLTLEANGFARFKIKKSGSDSWSIDMSEEAMGKPCYALYTGTEDAEEREIIRNIYNGSWDYIPNNIATQLRAKSSNNNLGEIIKVLMITSAGSEGINLRNTRYVHIMEPYWHPVRTEQVIGRARRICSHQSLPKALQTVEVFIYIMTFTEKQLDSEFAIELKLKDTSKRPPFFPQTSDQKLFEISTIKEQLTSQLLIGIKEASIDCATHIKSNTKEGLACLSFGQPSVNDFAYNPNISQDENDTVADINKTVIDWEARPFTHKPTGKRYMLRMDTNQVYDFDSVIQAKQTPGVRPILLGKLVKNSRGEYEIVKERV